MISYGARDHACAGVGKGIAPLVSWFSIAKHRYELKYSPVDLGAVGPPPPDVSDSDLFGKSLLERAGLDQGRAAKPGTQDQADTPPRYDPSNDAPGQIRFRHKEY